MTGARRSGRRVGIGGTRLRVLCTALTLLLAPLSLIALAGGQAQDVTFFRIGTGSSVGTYFPIGGIIASAISSPPGSRECQRGGSCGVPGLIAVAQSTNGSVDNVEGIASGNLESGFSQADVAYWAYHGTGTFADSGALPQLRAIANLYPEAVHLVVRRGAGINSVADLKGKRISLDREGSGTRVDALLILAAYGLEPKDLTAEALAVGPAADRLRAGELDGFFMVVGAPASAVEELANDNLISMVPIRGPQAESLLADYPYFQTDVITPGTYLNVGLTPTLSVGAQWLVSSELSEDLVYELTRALWHENTRQLLDRGHPKGRLIRLETALDGIGIPLHPGAERYYREQGLIPLEPAEQPPSDPAPENQ